MFKSHFPLFMSGNLSKICQLLDLESVIITREAYYDTISECLLQMQRPKGANRFLLMSQFPLVDSVPEQILRHHLNMVVDSCFNS